MAPRPNQNPSSPYQNISNAHEAFHALTNDEINICQHCHGDDASMCEKCHFKAFDSWIKEFFARGQQTSDLRSPDLYGLCQQRKPTAPTIVEPKVKLINTISHTVSESVKKLFTDAWSVCNFSALPEWMQDNDFLHNFHRPELNSYEACIKSVFRLHTETGNIWTHLIGCVIFATLAIQNILFSDLYPSLMDKFIMGVFFFGAILCLALSSCYHTVNCHSVHVGRLFSKLDYCGIASLITSSFIPWLYYGFYCELTPKLFYTLIVTSLCALTILVSSWDKFSEPHFRPLRASVFASFGLSGVLPGVHWVTTQAWLSDQHLKTAIIYLILMSITYMTGAIVYASRLPERFFPGKCDLFCHSHQLFHILVIIAALFHYQSISHLAFQRLNYHQCQVSF